MLDRTIAPGSKAIDNIFLLKPEKSTLKNGIQLFCFDAADADLLRIEFIFPNVAWHDEAPLAISVANKLITEGTSTKTAVEIAEALDFYGAFLRQESSADQSSLTLYTLGKYLEPSLAIVKEVLIDAIYPAKEVKTYIQNAKQSLTVNLQRNDVLVRRKFNEVLFGSNSQYGFNALPTDYDQINSAQLLAAYQKHYTVENCTIVASGKIKPEYKKLIENYFGEDWRKGTHPVQSNLQILPQPKATYFIEKPDALQSAIRIGKQLVNRSHSDFTGLQVLNTVLGGFFGSRLMANIREDKGYTYGIGSGIYSMQHAAYFFIATEVGTDVTGAAIAEIYKEINLLKTEPIPESELSLVRNYLLGNFLGSLENAFAHADKFKNIHFYGLGYDYYENYLETVKTITSNQLQSLANQYLNNDFYEVVVGKK